MGEGREEGLLWFLSSALRDLQRHWERADTSLTFCYLLETWCYSAHWSRSSDTSSLCTLMRDKSTCVRPWRCIWMCLWECLYYPCSLVHMWACAVLALTWVKWSRVNRRAISGQPREAGTQNAPLHQQWGESIECWEQRGARSAAHCSLLQKEALSMASSSPTETHRNINSFRLHLIIQNMFGPDAYNQNSLTVQGPGLMRNLHLSK